MDSSKRSITLIVCLAFVIPVVAQDQNPIDTGLFFALMDADNNGTIGREEWETKGLMDFSFPLCDRDNNDAITVKEMSACAVSEAMDPDKEGILTVYSGGRFVIPSPGNPIPKPENAPPGITQATQFVAESPYVEGGPTGEEFIKLFDADEDGKVGHMEWEKVKNNTVFKPFRWPQYNKNRDQWITLDEAPQPPGR